MILLLDLAYEKDSLSRYEFVHPIADSVRRRGCSYEILHFSEIRSEGKAGSVGEVGFAGTERYDKIILCGIALKDNVFRGQIDSFSWIKEFVGCILGICAGMQVIGSVFGGEIIPQADIGLKKIDIVRETPLLGEPRQIEGYHLHSYGVTLPDGFQLVAGKSDYVEAFWHHERSIYGILFHPEVRNRWMVERFVQINPH